MDSILVAQAGKQLGPFTKEEAAQLVQTGELSANDLAWQEGMENWVPLYTLLPQQPHLPPPLPKKSRKGLVWLAVGIGAALFLLLVVVVAVVAVSRVAMKEMEKNIPPSTESSWKTFTLKGLTLETPIALKSALIPQDGENKEVFETLVLTNDMVQGQGKGIHLTATVISYKPGTTLSLDGGVEGMLSAMAKELNVEVPDYTSTETTVKGQPAREVSVVFTVKTLGRTETVPVRAILIESGLSFAQVLTIQTVSGTRAAATADRILKSVSYLPAGDKTASPVASPTATPAASPEN